MLHDLVLTFAGVVCGLAISLAVSMGWDVWRR